VKLAEPLEIGGVVIEEVDYRSLSDDRIRLLNTFENVMRAEAAPEDPPRPVSLTEADERTLPDYFVVRQFWGFDPDGGMAAQGFGWWTATEDNRHVVNVGIEVRPDRRRRGIARELLRLMVGVAESEGRSLLIGRTIDRVPEGEAFARRVGAQLGLATHVNRLVLADVDRNLVRRWADEGPARASGYVVVTFDSPYPDDQLEQIADLAGVMNTAPLDDLQLEDRQITADHVRQWERSMRAAGTEGWALFARHVSSGRLVGYTEVRWNPHEPTTVWQGDTGVRPEHRGHALGKWLKASMLERILADRPGVEDIRTGNADSNAPMLGINHALGFKPYIAHMGWQIPTQRARAYVDGSSD